MKSINVKVSKCQESRFFGQSCMYETSKYILCQYNSRVFSLASDAERKKLLDDLHAEYMEKEGRRDFPLEELIILSDISIVRS
jgi:hypothetical protein